MNDPSKITQTFVLEHEDDDDFLMYLLNNYLKVLEHRNGTEKLLVAQEIARVLGRKAAHIMYGPEEGDFDKWYRNAIYVCRMGLDYGESIAYRYHEEGKKLNDPDYYIYMSWLHIHYSMLLYDSQRYYAAIASIEHARSYNEAVMLMLDDDKSIDRFLRTLMKMPECKNLVPKGSKKELIKQFREGLQSELSLERVILSKQARIVFRYYQNSPRAYRDLYASCTLALLFKLIQLGGEKEVKPLEELLVLLKRAYPDWPPVYGSILNTQISPLNLGNMSEDETKYVYWCNANHLLLTNYDLIPELPVMMIYARDDIVLKTGNQLVDEMFEDLTEAFSHCRFLLYQATSYIDPAVGLEYLLSPNSNRIHYHEVLLDMYPRLYSILDKLAHVVYFHFKISLKKKNKEADPTFNRIARRLYEEPPENPFLKALVEIFIEINPGFTEKGGLSGVPFYLMHPSAERMDTLRNHIVHSGLCLSETKTDKKSDGNITYISEAEFAQQCTSLITLVHEAIMDTHLAIVLDIEGKMAQNGNI